MCSIFDIVDICPLFHVIYFYNIYNDKYNILKITNGLCSKLINFFKNKLYKFNNYLSRNEKNNVGKN